MMRRLNLRKYDKGTAQLEFAFSATFMLVALFTLLELCNAVYTFMVLSEAANEGVRYAIVHSTDANFTSDVTNKVTSYARNAAYLNTSNISSNCGANNLNFVTISCPDSGGSCPGSVPGRVEVTVCYPYLTLSDLFRHLNVTTPTMQAYAEGRLVY